MLYVRGLLPTLHGTAYHSTFQRPSPLVAWSRSPLAHSGHLQPERRSPLAFQSQLYLLRL